MEDIPPELLKNGELFDFNEATDNFGFEFENLCEDNWNKFINTTYINDFIIFRKGYLERDYGKLDFYSHKFKGNFRLFISPLVADKCEQMQSSIKKGCIFVDQLYADIVNRMLEFLHAMVDLGIKIKKPINSALLEQFWNLNNTCNELEDDDLKKKLNLNDMIEIGEYGVVSPCCNIPNACIIF